MNKSLTFWRTFLVIFSLQTFCFRLFECIVIITILSTKGKDFFFNPLFRTCQNLGFKISKARIENMNDPNRVKSRKKNVYISFPTEGREGVYQKSGFEGVYQKSGFISIPMTVELIWTITNHPTRTLILSIMIFRVLVLQMFSQRTVPCKPLVAQWATHIVSIMVRK